MKIKNIYPLFALLFLSIISCETTEKIDDFPLRPPKLVVNCFFSQDSTWEFQVSRSLSVLDNADLKYVSNATIKLFEGGVLLDTIANPDRDGWYRIVSHLPQEGLEYSIEVSSPDYENTLFATEKTPETVSIKDVSVVIRDSSYYEHHNYDGRIYYGGNVEGTFNLLFDDPAAIENYYEVSLFYYDTLFNEEDSTQYTLQRNLIPITSEDASIVNNEDNYFKLLASDAVFDGQSYRLKIDFSDWRARRNRPYFIVFTSLNKSGYLYRKSIDDYNIATGDPFSEPVQIFCNIKNGYGIFSGYATNIYQVKL